jgi:uncharacterized protein (TIGR03000 family)
MIRKLGVVIVLTALGWSSVTSDAPACGRRGGRRSVSCCPSTCWSPCFRMCCHLYPPHKTGYVNPDVEIPFEVDITNWSPYSWGYSTAEYSYALFDHNGWYVPGGITVRTVPGSPHSVQVDFSTTAQDLPPHGVFLNMDYNGGPVHLGHWYKLVVYFRCHCCSFWLRPVQDLKGDKAGGDAAALTGSESASLQPRPATILVALPFDATLAFDGQPTESTSEQRLFVTPALESGAEYPYELTATVTRNGHPVSVTRQIYVRPGETTKLEVEFPSHNLALR